MRMQGPGRTEDVPDDGVVADAGGSALHVTCTSAGFLATGPAGLASGGTLLPRQSQQAYHYEVPYCPDSLSRPTIKRYPTGHKEQHAMQKKTLDGACHVSEEGVTDHREQPTSLAQSATPPV